MDQAGGWQPRTASSARPSSARPSMSSSVQARSKRASIPSHPASDLASASWAPLSLPVARARQAAAQSFSSPAGAAAASHAAASGSPATMATSAAIAQAYGRAEYQCGVPYQGSRPSGRPATAATAVSMRP